MRRAEQVDRGRGTWWRATIGAANDRRKAGVELARLATVLMLHGTPIVPLMARAMRMARPDIVHLHFPNPMAALACLVASRLDVPISHHLA